MSRISYLQRLNRDVAELFAHNFNCSSSTLNVIQTSDYLQANGSLVLQISIYEGPYRGGCFLFSLNIPEAYPFRPVDIFAAQPIWHPNVDLFSGKVALPMEWSPVLTLNSLALAVQMLLLEPSSENPLNMDAYSYYLSQSDTFEQLVQKSIRGGCTISGVRFGSVMIEAAPPSQMQQELTGLPFGSPGRLIAHTGRGGDPSPRPSTPFSFAHSTSAEGLSDLDRPTGEVRTVTGTSLGTAMDEQEYSPCVMDDQCSSVIDSVEVGLNVATLSNSVVNAAISSAGSALKGGKKRHFEHTKSSMELDALSRREGYDGRSSSGNGGTGLMVPGLVRLSSMEEWNQRISLACSQLSLGSAVPLPGPLSGPGDSSGRQAPVPEGPAPLQHLLRPVAQLGVLPLQAQAQGGLGQGQSQGQGVLGHDRLGQQSVDSALDKLSAGNGSDRSLSSMDVCSPYKKVKFCLGES